MPLITRRCAAWAIEVSLCAASALVPFGIGVYANSVQTEERVPLNPVLQVTDEAIARTLALPVGDSNRNVAPLTNLFWSAALVAPLALTGWQLYLLAKTGSTTPKRWFGVRVVTALGEPPGLARVLVREGIGRWGLPLSLAYLLWRYSGAFPDLGIIAGLSWLLVLGEGMSYLSNRGSRRCLHDWIAGTYAVDATCGIPARNLNGNGNYGGNGDSSYQWIDVDEDGAIAAIVLTPEVQKPQQRSLWQWMRQHPGLTLVLVALSSMAAVLGTLVGTQIYVQGQTNRREEDQQNRQQFLALVKQLSPNSPATIDERRSAILALGTIDDAPALQLLVDLLAQETNPTLLDATQQALASAGLKAMPFLQRLNQSLNNELESLRYSGTSKERALRAFRLQATQRAIAKILVIYSGKAYSVDLSRTDLGQKSAAYPPFTLVLDKTDVSGVQFKSANLNNASLRNTRFRGVGEDNRWNTYDDWIADLSLAQMQQVNLTGANLSRTRMNRTNLIKATINGANLAGARLVGANLSSALLVGANLREAVLENASLTGADLGEANLTGANLYAARLSRVSAAGTKFGYANLLQSDWQGSDLSGADFNHANLRSANLSATRLVGANLRDAVLSNTNLRSADLSLADLRGANVAGADFQGVMFVSSNQAQPDQFIQSPLVATTRSAIVQGVDFSTAKNLDVKQLAYICTQGGRHSRCP